MIFYCKNDGTAGFVILIWNYRAFYDALLIVFNKMIKLELV